MFCNLPEGYRPSDKEPFMNNHQKEYFRRKLLAWRDELCQHSLDTLHHLQEDSLGAADLADRAALEEDLSSELRARDRERKLIVKIEEALHRLEEGTYGFCEETGEPIGVQRLEARLVATLSLEAQEKREKEERIYRA